MFEKATPQPIVTGTRIPGSDGAALRRLDWAELTTRLNAARDLRLLLNRENADNDEPNGASFADAAARYFRARDEDQRDVNPVALEHRKGSPGMIQEYTEICTEEASYPGHAAKGDARED